MSRAGFKRYFKNTAWMFLGQGFQLGVGFFITVAVARFLGPSDFGVLNFHLAVVMILGVLANLGMTNVLTRELVERVGEKEKLIGTSVLLTLMAGGCIYVLLLGTSFLWSGSGLNRPMCLVMGFILLLNPARSIEAWFQSQVKSKFAVITTSVSFALTALCRAAFILLGLTVVWFGAAFTIEAVFVAVLLVSFYRYQGNSVSGWRFDVSAARELLRDSWPLVLSNFSVMIYLKIDFIFLSRITGDFSAGEYAAATRLSTIWYYVPMLLAQSLFPAIVKLKSESAARYGRRLQQFCDLNSVIAYFVMIPGFFLGPWLVGAIFGEGYQGGGSILSIHILSCLFVFLGVAKSQVLISEGRSRELLVCNALGAMVNVAGNLILIPVYGGVGAAIATLMGVGVSGVLTSFIFPVSRQIGYTQLRACAILFRMNALRTLLSVKKGTEA